MTIKEVYPHAMSCEEVADRLDTFLSSGISDQEARKRLEECGLNELIQKKKISPFAIFIEQFKDFLVYLLFFAIAISIIVGFYELVLTLL